MIDFGTNLWRGSIIFLNLSLKYDMKVNSICNLSIQMEKYKTAPTLLR